MKSWGYSGQVGEWNVSVYGGRSLSEQMERVVEIVDSLAPILKPLHQLVRARADLSILKADCWVDGLGRLRAAS